MEFLTPPVPVGEQPKPLPDLTTVVKPPPPVPFATTKGYYIFAYKLKKENNGKFRFAVTDHTSIEKFIEERLRFGVDTLDVKVVDKTDDYLEALSVMDILILEENQEIMERGGIVKRTGLGRILNARYTLKEILSKDTKVKKYDV